MKFFKYYYFRLFSYFSTGTEIPFFRTFAVIFLFAFFNFLTIMNAVSILGKGKKTPLTVSTEINWFLPLLIILPLFSIFFYYLKNLGGHKIIIEEFQKETSKQRFLGGLLIILYLIGSIALFILTLWLRQKYRNY